MYKILKLSRLATQAEVTVTIKTNRTLELCHDQASFGTQHHIFLLFPVLHLSDTSLLSENSYRN